MLPPRSSYLRAVVRIVAVVLVAVVLPVASSSPPAMAATVHCVGYDSCSSRGLAHGGYAASNQRSYWSMVTGHNCTNYAAFRIIQAGGPAQRPWSGSGDAHRWGHELPGITDGTPAVGSIAWWDSFRGGWGANGHVAYVERVLSTDTIVISEDIYNGDFRWRTISRGEAAWPTGFIHLADERVRSGKAPTIVGKAQVGRTLRVGAGSWSPNDVQVAYQWLADGRPVRGATAGSLRLTPPLAGARLSVDMTARRLGHLPGSVRTAPSERVARGRIAMSRAPRIRGRAVVGTVLRIAAGRTRPQAQASYRWTSAGKPIRGADAGRLRLTPKHTGERIAVTVTWRRVGYRTLRRTVRAPGRVAAARLRELAPPRIVGTAQVGSTLRAVPARWSATPGRRYVAWLVDGEIIVDQYTRTLLIGPELVGRTLVAAEGATKPGHQPVVALSSAVVPVADDAADDAAAAARR